MANSYTNQARGAAQGSNLQLGVTFQSGGTIPPWRLVEASSGKVVVGTANSTKIVGAMSDVGAANLDVETQVVINGACPITAEAPITAGQNVKCAANGKVVPLIDSTLTGTTLKTSSNGLGFTNQPANDGVTIVSNDNTAGEKVQKITIYGTTNGTDTVVSEVLSLNGTTPVNSVKVDWGVILGWKTDVATLGTVTLKETSGGLTISTITAGVLTKGIDSGTWYAYNAKPTGTGNGATTKQFGLIGTDSSGATIMDSKALNGTTAVTMNSAFRTITAVLFGDLETTPRTVAVKVGALDEVALGIGKALETQATVDQTVWVKLW